MIKTTTIILEELKNYKSPMDKLSRMIKNGELIKITKGLYETDKNVSNYLLAGSIYGPSYISFEYALAYYGLIPEAVYTITCATFSKKKKKLYETPFGTFSYRDVPSIVYYKGIRLKYENNYSYCIAIPEKALCDQLYKLPPVKNYHELQDLLFEDMRLDKDSFAQLNIEIIEEYAYDYGNTNIKKLAKFMRRTL